MKAKEKTEAVVQRGIIAMTEAAKAAIACVNRRMNVVLRPPKGRRGEHQQ